MNNDTLRRFAILKWVPRLLMIGIIGFSVYVYFRYGNTENNTAKAKIVNSGRSNRQKNPAIQKTHNLEYSHFDKGKLVYHVSADQTETRKSQQQVLENPVFTFYDEHQQETIKVSGKKCTISKDFSTITVTDDAFVISPNGMSVESEVIRYDSEERIFSSPAESSFDYNALKGKSNGFTYHIDTEQLELPDSPQVLYVKRDELGVRRPILMTGNKGFIDRKSGFAYFDGDVEVTQRKDTINADRIEAQFEPEGSKLQKITGLQNVHVRFSRPDAPEKDNDDEKPARKKKEAEKDEAPAVTQSAPANKQAPSMANVFAADSQAGKDLDAQVVELYFYDDGSTIKSFHSEGDCVFILHSFDDKDRPIENRIINGQTFDATFNDVGQMMSFHANEQVSVKLQPFGNKQQEDEQSRQTIFCDDLVSTFIPETGDVKDIHFNKNFKHTQDKRVVSSDNAVFDGAARKTNLIGSPEIDDPSYNITANNMELFEDTSGIHAFGNVKSRFVQDKNSKTDTPHTFPFASPSGQPVYISSEDMVWNSQKSEAAYTVKAKLWQDKNVITAERLVINDRDRTLSAYQKVHTIFYSKKKPGDETQTQTAPGAQTKPAVAQKQQPSEGPKVFGDDVTPGSQDGPISVDAGVMNYAENDRIVHFEKDVRVVTPTTTINSQKADFYLKEKNQEFDRLYAMGNVTIKHESKTGTGEQATFYSDEKKLVLEGHPKLTEPGQADVLGTVLTMFLGDDRILIDGQEDGRATTVLATKGNPSSDSSKKKKDKDNSAGSED